MEGDDYLVDCPHAVIKTNVGSSGNLVSVLDVMGNSTIVDLKVGKVLSMNQLCTDILSIGNDFYSQAVTLTEQKLIRSQVSRHEGETLHLEANDFRMSTALAGRDFVQSFFSQSLSSGQYMLLMNGKTLYLRDVKE